MASTDFLLRRVDGGVFTLAEIGGYPVAVVDLRPRGEVPVLESYVARLREQMRAPGQHPQIQLIVLTLPQRTDMTAINLARQGIYLISAPESVAAAALVDRFGRTWSAASTSRPAAPPLPTRRRSADAEVFSQPPPGFDPAAFEERMRALQQPWQEKDRWESDS